jgi:hypothetical protein
MIDFTESSQMRTNASGSPKTKKPNIIPKGQMTDEQLLKSLQGTMATIDPYSVKKEAIDEYLIDTIEERLTRIEDKVDLLITQLKIEFYKKNDRTSR